MLDTEETQFEQEPGRRRIASTAADQASILLAGYLVDRDLPESDRKIIDKLPVPGTSDAFLPSLKIDNEFWMFPIDSIDEIGNAARHVGVSVDYGTGAVAGLAPEFRVSPGLIRSCSTSSRKTVWACRPYSLAFHTRAVARQAAVASCWSRVCCGTGGVSSERGRRRHRCGLQADAPLQDRPDQRYLRPPDRDGWQEAPRRDRTDDLPFTRNKSIIPDGPARPR